MSHDEIYFSRIMLYVSTGTQILLAGANGQAPAIAPTIINRLSLLSAILTYQAFLQSLAASLNIVLISMCKQFALQSFNQVYVCALFL